MLHICFDDSAYCTIRHAMKLGLIEKENVLLFYDDLSVGDISNCREYKSRKDVIHSMYDDEFTNVNDDEVKDEFDKFYKKLYIENDFVIWYAHNPKDYCNLYYVVSLIEDKNIEVIECLKKTVGDITLCYKWVGEINPKDIPMFLKSARSLSKKEKYKYKNEWQALILENGLLRAKVSEELKTVNEDYYDELLLERVPNKSKRIARIVGEFIGMDKPCLRDWFVVWRIKHLAEIGCVEIDYRCDRYMFNDIKKSV